MPEEEERRPSFLDLLSDLDSAIDRFARQARKIYEAEKEYRGYLEELLDEFRILKEWVRSVMEEVREYLEVEYYEEE